MLTSPPTDRPLRRRGRHARVGRCVPGGSGGGDRSPPAASVTTCGCGDTSLFTWFLEWPAYALSHGTNPLYSTHLFHPGGINLLSNTAEVGLGIALAPVTWLFGPIATLNVALTLSPALSAFTMYVLLRRWVS